MPPLKKFLEGLNTDACVVYMITIHDGRRYIGKTVNLKTRLCGHHWRKEMVKLEVLQECDRKELADAEWDWVKKLNPELNKTVPVLSFRGDKVWACPEVVAAQAKRWATIGWSDAPCVREKLERARLKREARAVRKTG